MAVVALVITVALLIINDKQKQKKAQKKYFELFQELYEVGHVIETLEQIRDAFKKDSIEYIAIDQAVFYLDHSIMRDYRSAFDLVEKVFELKEIKERHMEVIETEKERIQLALSAPSGM
jgi:hypothetical protein